MISISLIGIILIIVIVILYFLIKRSPKVVEEEEPELYVLFNDPLFIKPHELSELLSILVTSTDLVITRELCLHGDSMVTPIVPLDKYFSVYDYNCVVTKTEPMNQDTFKVTLTFTKNKIFKEDDINRPPNK